MSAGAFVDATYLSDLGTAFPIRVQPETIATWNAEGAGVIAAGMPSAQSSQSKRSLGVNARTATFRFTGTPPTGYLTSGTIKLPILTLEAWRALVRNTAYAYLGGTLNLVGKTAEVIK